jgi:pimeloyl-ACP methyl ester carboxylesterase
MADRFECAADRDAMTAEFADWMAASFRAAFASGIEGVRGDFVAFRAARDWGFKVAQSRRVAIWHGAEDPMQPVANAVWLGEHILDAELHVLPDEGHVSIGLRFREIFDDLISRSQQPDREGA